MNKVSTAAKITAWFLLVVFAFVFFLSVAGVAVLIHTGAYWDGGRIFREEVASEVFSFDKERIRYVLNEYKRYSAPNDAGYRQMYDPENSNVFFIIRDNKGNVVVDYKSDAEYQIKYEYEEFYKHDDKSISETKYFDTKAEAQEYIKELEQTYFISSWSYLHTEGKLEVTFCDYEVYTVEAYIRRSFTAQDRYFYSLKAVDLIVAMRYWVILIGFTCSIICLLLVIFLCSSSGRFEDEKHRLNLIHRTPIDLYLGFCTVFIVSLIAAFVEFSSGGDYELITVLLFVFIFTLCAILTVSATVVFSARVKQKGWWRNTVIYYIFLVIKKLFCFIKDVAKYVVRHLPILWKALIALIAVKALELIFMIINIRAFTGFWILEFAAILFAVIYIVVALRKLQKAATEISGGNLDYRADLSNMPGVLREHGEHLNNIGAGLKTALEEQVKSEHMKAELITNVSHDIKTPLTSIVNYVDLLKKEGIESETAKEYLDVLDRQAIKLKKLTEDLIEASKATSGCVTVNAERTDINVLLSQASGEYEGKFMEKGLAPVLNLAIENPEVFADGGLLWRVFDNLLNNICKYSQQNTRVYLKSEVREEKVFILFSNISEAQLGISSDELMERFVRGDSSRNTEGSGLGLSIARSLIELQGGTFNIIIDGDLFKVEISFDVLK